MVIMHCVRTIVMVILYCVRTFVVVYCNLSEHL